MPIPKLNFKDSGVEGKQTIIFLHGFPFNLSMWDQQAELCKPHFRVLTYDHRGHGQSAIGDGPCTFEFFVDDLLGLMDHLRIEKAILCGLSMGGYVALRMMERHPERAQALILCDTRSEADSDATRIKRASDLRLIQNEGIDAFAEKFLKGALAPSSFVKQPAVVERVRRMILANPLDGVKSTLVALATRTDTTLSLARIQVPTLILVGEEDSITPPSVATALHERIARSVMAIIPKAGHVSNLENPEAFNARFLDFIKQFSA